MGLTTDRMLQVELQKLLQADPNMTLLTVQSVVKADDEAIAV